MQKTTIYAVGVILVILVGAGSFFGGMKYYQKKSGTNFQRSSVQGQFGQGNRTGYVGRQASGQGFVNGQIIAKEDKSITVKSRDGGSKLVFLSESTEISKSATGTVDDLAEDAMIIANGATNPDGSITATNIQIHQSGLGFGSPGVGAGPQDSLIPEN
ncbi:MAG: hypothetical protein BWY51_00764 [Parcubacteria group bacterium ADurb.Bin316]|nr:MAG: hypothetical protein BWY51_00764 [Parcubacteria group bacterium ADurb.Bin316]HOZ56440.1 hypothetical protein [bacterium]